MSKFSNIYDIDGNLIHKAGDGPYTIEQTEELVDKLTKKVQENPDNQVYKVYLNNAQAWLYKLYNEMNREDLIKRLTSVQSSIGEAKKSAADAEKKQLDELNDIMEEFKQQYDSKPEITAKSSEDGDGGELVEEVERSVDNIDSPKPTVMDEYVEFTEE